MRIRIPYWPLAILPYLAEKFGWALNIAAISVNHGIMPVLNVPWIDWSDPDPFHRLLQASDHLKFLTDVIVLPHEGAISLGDVFISLGEWALIPALVAWVALIARDYSER